MKAVYKYTLGAIDEMQPIPMPKNAKILRVKYQKNKIVLYAEVEMMEKEVEKRWFKTFGTGHPLSPDHLCNYIDTVMLFDGDLVLHIYELVRKPELNPKYAVELPRMKSYWEDN